MDLRKQHLRCLGRPGGTTPYKKHTALYLLAYPMGGGNCSTHKPFDTLSFVNDTFFLVGLSQTQGIVKWHHVQSRAEDDASSVTS